MVYVTKMKKKLVYEIESDTMYMHPEGVMEYRVQHVIFHKHVKEGRTSPTMHASSPMRTSRKERPG